MLGTGKLDIYNLIEERLKAFENSFNTYSKQLGVEYVSKRVASSQFDELFNIKQTLNKEKKISQLFKNIALEKKIKFHETQLNYLAGRVSAENDNYLLRRSKQIDPRVLMVGTQKLDQYQTMPIMVDERNTLVIAGAGTGKTSTILSKIKYLLIEQKVDPKDILVLTYTKSSSEDMKTKVYVESGIDLDIFTFHKLGLTVISKVEEKVPTLTNIKMSEFVQETIESLVKIDVKYANLLADYLSYHQNLTKSLFEFITEKEYEQYLKLHPIITIKGEKVKSGEEVTIANFLYRNRIDYIYEQKYIIDTSDSEYAQYRPDFYLPEYDIWIEHFAINRNKNIPPFFQGGHGKDAKQLYLTSMVWKRELHKENKTQLIETYSFEAFEGVLLTNLKQRLSKLDVAFDEMSPEEIINDLTNNRNTINGLTELFSTVINLAKINNMDSNQLSNMSMESKDEFVRNLITPILKAYETLLKLNHEIDYNDMLIKSIQYLDDERYIRDYKYVIVDEFQDMNKLTFELLRSLRKHSDYKLLGVGDDWQSIYRFAGSDLCYITEFEKYFGLAEIFYIKKTYRFGKSVAELSGRFVMRNPKQLRKEIISHKKSDSFDIGIIEGYSEKQCINFMDEKLNKLPQSSQVMLIGRYKNDIKLLDLNNVFDYAFSQKNNIIEVTHRNRKDLYITYSTVHSAKGLEADYVFILNNKDDNYGFPSIIQDNPIVEYFLKSKESFPFAEERRLFYVGLTRTENKVWLLTPTNCKSVFVKELEKQYKNQFQDEKYACPKCGRMLKEIKINGTLSMVCINYPKCTYTMEQTDYNENLVKKIDYYNKSRLANDKFDCPKCGYKLRKINGKYGQFMGCTNYPKCNYSIKLNNNPKPKKI